MERNVARRKIVREHVWKDAAGRAVFVHRKYDDGAWGYRYRVNGRWVSKKPEKARELLWNMQSLSEYEHPTIWWCAGEKDADACKEAMLADGIAGETTSVHQGEKAPVYAEQLEVFRDYPGDSVFYLVTDADLTGYGHAIARYDGLVGVGVSPDMIEVLLPGEGFNDLSDHLDGGEGLSNLRNVGIDDLRKLVAKKDNPADDGVDTVAARKKLRNFRTALDDNGQTKGTGQDWTCPWPGHDDRRPSFGVDVGANGGLVLNCQSCMPEIGTSEHRVWIGEILDELGLDWDDIQPPRDSGELDAERLAAKIDKAAREEYVRRRAMLVAQQRVAFEGWEPPGPEDSARLDEDLRRPRERFEPRIDDLLGINHNVVLAAQHKTGKTTLGLNVVKSALDDEPFLNRDVHFEEGNIGWINGEMDRNNFLDYAESLGIKGGAHMHTLHLRGRRLPIMDDVGAEWLVKWCRDRDIAWLFWDSWRLACAWSGISENKNDEVLLLTARVDEIKEQAGVQTSTWLAHTGRMAMDMGNEHARGATTIDDWADMRWVMVQGREGDMDTRYFYTKGRAGIDDFPETALEFNTETLRVGLGNGSRRDVKSREHLEGVGVVELIVEQEPGITAGSLKEKLRAATGVSNHDRLNRMVRAAVEAGTVQIKKKGKSSFHFPGDGKVRF